MNPLIPDGFDIIMTLLLLLATATLIGAVVSWARWPYRSTGSGRLWLGAIILLPLVGPIGWFPARRAISHRHPGAEEWH